MSVRTTAVASGPPVRSTDRLAEVLAAGLARLEIGVKPTLGGKGKQPAGGGRRGDDGRADEKEAKRAAERQALLEKQVKAYRRQFTKVQLAQRIAKYGYIKPTAKYGMVRVYIYNRDTLKKSDGTVVQGDRYGQRANYLDILAQLEGTYRVDPKTGIGNVYPGPSNESKSAISYMLDEMVEDKFGKLPPYNKKYEQRIKAWEKSDNEVRPAERRPKVRPAAAAEAEEKANAKYEAKLSGAGPSSAGQDDDADMFEDDEFEKAPERQWGPALLEDDLDNPYAGTYDEQEAAQLAKKNDARVRSGKDQKDTVDSDSDDD